MTARRCLGLLVLAVAAAAVLHAARTALPAPPVAEPELLGHWWTSQGTAGATLAVVRLGGLAFCCYLALISLLGAVAALTRWRWTSTLAAWLATPALRRVVVGGTLAVALSSTSTAAAATGSLAASVSDMGPVAPLGATVRDLGEIPLDRAAVTPASLPEFAVRDLGAAQQPDLSVRDLGETPTDDRALGETPTDDVRFGETPTDDVSFGEAPPGDRALGETPTDDVSFGETPTDDVSFGETPTDDVSFGETPTGDVRFGEAPGSGPSPTAAPGSPPAATETPRSRPPTAPPGHRATPETASVQDQTESAGTTGTWLVEAGDHLWGIAAETVAERAGTDDHMTVLRYWLHLIEANQDTVGDDPDLIYPGQVIRLPA